MTSIRTAILSFGMSGRVFHAPFIALNPQFELVGIWERTSAASLELYPGIHIYRSLEEVLGDASIDLVIVNTPTYTHYEYCKKTLLAGKHAVVEKAFTTTVAEARELEKIANEKGLKLSVFQNRRWDSDFKTVKQVIDRGLLGKIVEAEIHFDRFKEELSPKLHKETPGPGAGVLYDLGPHLIDQSLVLFGMPEAVFADLRITRTGSLVDDYFEILLYYPTLRVRLKSGYHVREPFPAYIIHGSLGSFHKSRADVQEIDLVANEKPNRIDWGTEPIAEQGLIHTEKEGICIRERIPTLTGNYAAYYQAVGEAILQNRDMPVTATQGIQVMQIITGAAISHQTRAVVSL
jgi:predicted dehydrogenase